MLESLNSKMKILIVLLTIFICPFLKANDKVLYFYNWSEYIPTEILENFTKETGIKVIYSEYESNETMYAKLKTQGQGYDLVVPSTYFISRMHKENMLQKIDHTKLKYFKDLDPQFLNKPFDPNNNYSIPYTWGATGIGINTDVIDTSKVTSWNDLWNPKYKGQVMLMDDAREVFQMTLSTLGYSGNTQNEEEIKKAYLKLKKLIPNVLVFNSDYPANPFIEGETSIGMLWNGSAYAAQKAGAPIKIVWPKEGAILWMDSLAIPSGAKNVEAAYKMIDFLLRPENAAKIALMIGYPTPVKEAKKFLPEKFKNNPMIYPPEDVLKKSEWQSDVGDKVAIYEKDFEKLKASNM